VASRLLGKAVVVRELMPQDLKIEISRLSPEEAVSLAHYLAGVVGHGRCPLTHSTPEEKNTRIRQSSNIDSRYCWNSAIATLPPQKRTPGSRDAPGVSTGCCLGLQALIDPGGGVSGDGNAAWVGPNKQNASTEYLHEVDPHQSAKPAVAIQEFLRPKEGVGRRWPN
jgi:hypothetical protein